MGAQALELAAPADERRAAAGGEEALPGLGVGRRRRGGRGRRRRRLGALGLQHALELGLHLRPRRDAQLLAQQRPQALVHPQRLGEVALGLAHAHQQQVAALAERRAVDQLLRGALRGGELGAAERQPGVAPQLARLQPELLEPAARVLQPGRLVAGEQPGVRERLGAAGGLDDRAPVGAVAGGERRVQRRLGGVEVDLGAGRELHGALPGVDEHVGPERAAQLGEHDVERLRLAGGSVLAPQRRDQPLARDRLRAEREKGDGEATLAAGKLGLAPPSVDGDRELAAQFDDHLRGCHARVPPPSSEARLTEPPDRPQAAYAASR